MATFYKPSERRGKRLIYKSIDPDEPKRDALRLITLLVLVIMSFATAWLLSR
jgi:hypothetical protein